MCLKRAFDFSKIELYQGITRVTLSAMDPTQNANTDQDLDSQETELEWRQDRVNAAKFVALQLRDAKETEFDYETPIFGIIALFVSTPVAVIFYRRALWGSLWLLAIAAIIWFISFVTEFAFRQKLETYREKVATALDDLAIAILQDDGVSDD